MIPFLKEVASHYFAEGDVEHICFIFPNRRSRAFFLKYLGEETASKGTVPILAPEALTINDFFYRATKSSQTDRTRLLVELYGQYKALNQKAESLDDFIFWGDILLGDFDDVDKYLADPAKIFTNIAEFKKMQDGMEYLTDTQREAIERLIGHFRNDKDTQGEVPKAKFYRIWNLLLPLYRNFGSVLDKKKLSYEGKVYRKLAERLDTESVVDILKEAFPETAQFVFVGLNALNECEKKLMRKMRNAGIARFCWDWCSDMIKDPDNKSSFFMSRNVEQFPQDFELTRPDSRTRFSTLSVASATGQAKQLPDLIERLGIKDGNAGIETAVVLADETLLLPVLNSVPESVSSLNVTMGYPIKGSALWDLANDISLLQMHLRNREGKWYFHHKSVWSLLSNPLVNKALSDDGKKIAEKVRNGKKYYIPEEELKGDSICELLFQPVVTDPGLSDATVTQALEKYESELVAAIAGRVAELVKADECPDMEMELDFCKEFFKTIGRLGACRLEVSAQCWFRVLAGLLAGISVPFEGEPLNGLQVMGPLETRALDFRNVIILSCNEGMFPRKSVSSSFIPAELRKGFELPTYEYQDAVWAYYFYRLIQRAENVWMVYDSRHSGIRGGEESRYIKQLKMHFGIKMDEYALTLDIGESQPGTIIKTGEDLEVIRGKELSATALSAYLSCPAKFYFQTVKGLSEDEEVSETMDARIIGNVFHKTMQKLYDGYRELDAAELSRIRKDRDKIRKIVEHFILEELRSVEISGRNIIFEDMICEYVFKTLDRDIELVGDGKITLLGLETKLRMQFHGFRFKGTLDRLDSLSEGSVRVSDYKTGKVDKLDLEIDDGNYEEVLAAVTNPDDSKRRKVAFQVYIYDKLLLEDGRFAGKILYNSIYQCNGMFTVKVEAVEVCKPFIEGMDKILEGILDEISDTDRNWTRTEVAKNCEYCPFTDICKL